MPQKESLTITNYYYQVYMKNLTNRKSGNFTVRKDLKGNIIGKEYGFRVKGPEPTRYGDWESKGRCTDF